MVLPMLSVARGSVSPWRWWTRRVSNTLPQPFHLKCMWLANILSKQKICRVGLPCCRELLVPYATGQALLSGTT